MDNDQEDEEEFEVDIQEDEAAFLKGISSRSGVEMSPIKIVKNPDGSLQRAAMTQSALAKERRELREQQQRTLIEAIPKDSKPGTGMHTHHMTSLSVLPCMQSASSSCTTVIHVTC